jgi:hypothetical protein
MFEKKLQKNLGQLIAHKVDEFSNDEECLNSFNQTLNKIKIKQQQSKLKVGDPLLRSSLLGRLNKERLSIQAEQNR